MKRNQKSSSLPIARVAGGFYVLSVITGLSALALGAHGLASWENAANLAGTIGYLVVTVLFYFIFKPVNNLISLLAALISFAGCAGWFLDNIHLPPLPVDSMALFGFYCLLIGYLILRSTFLPRILGVLMFIASAGWLTFLSPPLGKELFRFTKFTGLLGEGSLTLWLLFKGVNVARWKQQASRVPQPRGVN